jgi:hypothetical protein
MRRERGSQSNDLRPEYTFDYSKAVGGKYYRRLIREGANVAVLEPDVAAAGWPRQHFSAISAGTGSSERCVRSREQAAKAARFGIRLSRSGAATAERRLVRKPRPPAQSAIACGWAAGLTSRRGAA